MKLVTYSKNGNEQLAFYVAGKLYDTKDGLPATMGTLLNNWEQYISAMHEADKQIKSGNRADGIPFEGE